MTGRSIGHQPQHQPQGGKARRVYLLLRDQIAKGALAAGDLLPGESRLAQAHGVSRVTVRRALEALDSEGLIEKRAGAGTVIRAARTEPGMAADIATLIPQLVEMSSRTTARLLSFAYGIPPAHVAQALGLAPDQRVQTAVRVRLSDGVPFSHLTTHVPEPIAARYSEADLATTPLFQLLERGGVRLDAAHQSVSAALASPEVAAALEVAEGSALLALTRVVRDAGGAGVEYLSALYRPDLFRLEMTLTRVGGGNDRHWAPVIGGGTADARRAAPAPREAAE